MSSFSNVSLILQADAEGNAPSPLSQTIHAMASRHWDAEVLLVDPSASTDSASKTQSEQPANAGPRYQRLKTLEAAISAAQHSIVAIVDGNFEVTPAQWQLAVDRLEQSPVQAVYQLPPTRRRYKRLLVWWYTLMWKFFFRTQRNELQVGLTVINRSALSSGMPTPTQQPGRFRLSWQVARLLANLKIQHQAIREIEIKDRSLKRATDPSSQTIRQSSSRAIRMWWTEIMFPKSEHELDHKRTKPIEKYSLIVVLAVVAISLFFGNLNYPLIEPDEARNAQLAVNLVNSGQWMSLSLADEYYWDKPPMQIWAIAASYKVFGVSPFATRFPVALAAFVTVLATLLIGKRLVGFRAAWLGAGLLLLTSGFVFSGRFVTMDASLTAMTSLVLMLGLIAIRDQFKKRLAICAGIACGLGFLIKGPIIAVLCGPPLIAYAWISRPSQPRTKRRWIWFAAPAVLVGAPWYIATAIIHPEFLSYFFWKHHVVRFSNAFNHREPFWFYIVGIFLFMFPASYLLPSVVKFIGSRNPTNRLLRTREQGFLFLSAIWIIGFFSISESKLPTYIIPSFPAICLLMGVLLERKVLNKPKPITSQSRRTFLEGLTQRAPIEMVVTMAALSIAVFWLEPSKFTALIRVGIPTAIVAVGVIVATRYRPLHRTAWAGFGLIALLLVTLGTHVLVPSISKTRSFQVAARQISKTPEYQHAPIVFFGRENHGVGLNLERKKIVYFKASQNVSLIKFLQQNPTAIIVSSSETMETLRDDLPWTISLKEYEPARHLFLSHPNRKIIARERNQQLYR